MKAASPNRLALYKRAQEAIEFLMECNGHTTLTKQEFAEALAVRFSSEWKRGRKLVEEVCTLTRDQDQDPYAASICGGYVIAYAPNIGGMTLLDPSGNLSFKHLLHMLAGDLSQQQKAKTVNRRRVNDWNALGHQALNSMQPDLGRIAFQIEREIEATGFVSDLLVEDFLRLVNQQA